MGGILSMKCSDKLWRSVAFVSKSLSNTEHNYEIQNTTMKSITKRC